eukprot:m.74240 g.74240  ORF g.74240 m.74240 type:complete len:283 (+) comp17086_c0_seq2:64-912(+)
MKRLFGTHNKGKNVKALEGEDDSAPPTKCDKFIFVLRVLVLLSTLVTGFLTAAFTDKLVRGGHCMSGLRLTPSDEVVVDAQGNSVRVDTVYADYGPQALCVGGKMFGLCSGTFAALLFIVCLYNVRSLRMRAQVSCMAKLELALKVVFCAGAFALFALNLEEGRAVCGQLRRVSQAPCAQAASDFDDSRCPSCVSGMMQGLPAAFSHVAQVLLANGITWGLVAVIAVMRHVQARRRAADLAVARAKDEEEMRAEFERRKEAEAKQKAAGQGEGKGFVYRLLM